MPKSEIKNHRFTVEKAQRYFDALKRIASYDAPEKIRRHAVRDYGVGADDAIEMAYDNVRDEAKAAITGQRRPKVAR